MNGNIPAWVHGVLTPYDKLAAHRLGLKHLAVSVFVVRGNQMLIQRRALNKYHTPGLWANTCCTHPNWGENATNCAIRRLGEEMGISGLKVSHRGRVEYRAPVGGGMTEHEVVDIYVSEAPEDLTFTLNPDEVMDHRWVGIYDLSAEIQRRPQRFTPWIKIYMEEHMTRIFGPRVPV